MEYMLRSVWASLSMNCVVTGKLINTNFEIPMITES